MPTRSSRLKRLLAVAALASGAAACSSEGSGDWVAIYRTARNYWNSDNDSVSLDRAATVPYATMGVRLDDGPEQMFILATDAQGEQLWSLSTRMAIAIRNGRVVRTAGLAGGDLQGSYGAGDHEPWATPHRYSWTADFRSLSLYGVPVECDVRPKAQEPIVILGRKFDTVRVEEHCDAAKIGWSFDNTYWVSATTGIVWRSIQHVSPKGPALEFEILRPPASFA